MLACRRPACHPRDAARTDDPALKGEGKLQEAKGDLQKAVGKAKDAVKKAADL